MTTPLLKLLAYGNPNPNLLPKWEWLTDTPDGRERLWNLTQAFTETDDLQRHRDMECSAVQGRKADGGDRVRCMDGLIQQIKDQGGVVHDMIGAPIAPEDVDLLMDGCFKRKGSPTHLVFNPQAVRERSNLALPKDRDQGYQTEFGRLKLVESLFVPQDALLVITDRCAQLVHRWLEGGGEEATLVLRDTKFGAHGMIVGAGRK